MTGASDTLDPIQAAEAGIAGSKHLIASVANDLSQQERWLAHYRVAERRHARRLWFQELMYQLELRRRRLMRWSKRLALITWRWTRSAAVFLWRTAVSLFLILRRVTTTCLAWLRPRVYALAIALAELMVAFWAWARVEARLLARALHRAASIGFAWLAVQSRALAVALEKWLSAVWSSTFLKARVLAQAFLKGVSVGAMWSVMQSRALALTLRRELVHFASWTNKKAGHFSRASLATASLGFSWSKPTRPQSDANHRTLVVKRGTALICIEPWRARLPAIRAG